MSKREMPNDCKADTTMPADGDGGPPDSEASQHNKKARRSLVPSGSMTRRSSIKCVDDGEVIVIPDESEEMEVDGAWLCSVCHAANPVSVEQCITCLEMRKPDAIFLQDAASFLKDSCHTSDDANASKLSKLQPIAESSGDDSVWICRRCTLENMCTSERCDACEAPRRDNLPKLVVVKQDRENENDITDHESPSMGKGPVPVSVPSIPRTNAIRKPKEQKDKAKDIIDQQPTGSNQNQVSDQGVWTCHFCSFNNNPGWARLCDMCQSVRQEYSTPVKVVTNGKAGPAAKDRVVTPKAGDVIDLVSPRQTTWQCEKCQSKNSNVVRDCANCGTLRVQKTPDAVQRVFKQSDIWTCQRCTLINSNTAHVCAACQSKRDTKLPTIDDVSDTIGWPCATCTYMNSPEDDVCQACETRRKTDNAPEPVAPSNIVQPKLPALSRLTLHRENSVLAETHRQIEENKARDQWIHIVNFCRVNKEKFVDDSFPPINKSLYYAPNSHSGSVNRWMRPSDGMVPHDDTRGVRDWTVFSDPKPTDICQGVLGNCWFLSSLSVIAERRELLERILITKELCPQGVYQVQLCLDGDWKAVIIDDLFPCDPYKRLVYSQAKRRQLWVPLIEKALAKMHGCYQALSRGRCIEGLATLTGAPCESIQLSGSVKNDDEKDIVWVRLLSSRESGFLMGASCGSGNMKVDEKDYEQRGLVARHAYSILDVRDVEQQRLVKLRNPWGRFSWKGEWSRPSESWKRLSDGMSGQLRPTVTEEAEGVFWMSFDDFLRFYDAIDICKVRSDWMESRQKCVLPSNAAQRLTVIQLQVFDATEFEFGLFQETCRGKDPANQNPVDLCISVFASHGASSSMGGAIGQLVHCSRRSVQMFVGTSVFLRPGDYIVMCMAFNHWSLSSSSVTHGVLCLHSCKAHLVQPMPLSRTALADAVIQLAIAKGERHEGRQTMTTYYLTRHWAGFIMVVENRDPDCALHVQCDCSSSENVVSTRGALKTVDAIPPLHRQVVVLLTQLERFSSYSISHRLVHRVWDIGTGLGDWAPGANHVPALTEDVIGLHAPRPLL